MTVDEFFSVCARMGFSAAEKGMPAAWGTGSIRSFPLPVPAT